MILLVQDFVVINNVIFADALFMIKIHILTAFEKKKKQRQIF